METFSFLSYRVQVSTVRVTGARGVVVSVVLDVCMDFLYWPSGITSITMGIGVATIVFFANRLLACSN